MNKTRGALPPSILRCLWSYDAASLDVHQDRAFIITQVLNYGNWTDLQWLYRTYPERAIKHVVAHPKRGLWLKPVLNFWCLMLKTRLPKRVRDRAIFRLEPPFL